MFNKSLAAILLLSLSMVAIAALPKKVVALQQWVTQRGTPVYFVRVTTLPILDIRILFNAGSARDGRRYGLASLTNGMLDEGTRNLNADQIASRFSAAGAIFDNGVNRDMAILTLRSLTDPKQLKPALDTFIDVLAQPTFPQRAFLRVQKQTLRAIDAAKQSPATVAGDALIRLIYGSHPYGHPVLGTAPRVLSLRRGNLRAFYRRYYVAKNAVIAIVGDITHAQAEAIANRLVQHLPVGAEAPKLPPVPQITPAATRNIPFPSAQTTILLGTVGIDRQDPDYFPLQLGNYILGDAPLLSRLYRELRIARGLVYGTDSGFTTLQEDGPFFIALQTRTHKAKEALALARRTLADFVKDGPTKDEVNAAKRYLIGSFPIALNSNAKIVSEIAAIGFYHLPLNYLDTYTQSVQSVDRKQILMAFHRHIQPKNMVTVLVGNTQAKSGRR